MNSNMTLDQATNVLKSRAQLYRGSEQQFLEALGIKNDGGPESIRTEMTLGGEVRVCYYSAWDNPMRMPIDILVRYKKEGKEINYSTFPKLYELWLSEED